MECNDIQDELCTILQETNMFRTAYQICKRIEILYPNLWERILNAYPVLEGNPPMGEGAGIHYSPASFIAKSLDYLSNRNGNVRKAYIDSSNVTFEGVVPGFKGGVSIWAWR